MELDASAAVGGDGRTQVAPAPRPLRHLNGDVLTGVVVQRAVQLQPDHRDVSAGADVFDHRAVAVGRALLGVSGASHHPDEQRDRVVGRLREPVIPLFDQLSAKRGEQRILHAVVMPLRHTVFAMVPTELREKGHRLLGPLVDEFTEQPRHRRGEGVSLSRHVRGKQVANRHVDGEPAGVEAPDQFVGAERGVDRVAQYAQRVTVVESHAVR